MSTPPTLAPAAAGLVPESPLTLWRRIDRGDLARVAVVAALAVAAAVAPALGAPWWVSVSVAVAGLAVGCWPIVVEAVEDARRQRMSMELSMLLAIVAAALIGEWVTALVITAFVLAAEILEDLSMDRGREALTELISFLPSRVRVRDGGELVDVDLEEVAVGDEVLVAPWGRVPVDGTVVDGASSVDASRITGEPLPVDVTAGASVWAGSVNQAGAIVVRTEKVGAESSYGQIVEAVRAAQSSEAPVQRLADRLAGWLVYVALAGAALTWLFTRDATATISVVIVAGACGVAAGTPLAVLAAIARTARSGAFVKDGAHLEELSAVDVVVFDKTGTLTHGQPVVAGVEVASGVALGELLALVASAELYSEHPVAQAILSHARAAGVEVAAPERFLSEPGLGVSATVAGHRVVAGNAALVPDPAGRAGSAGTAVQVAIDGTWAGTIRLGDTVRDSASGCVERLEALGARVVMMTGDSESAAREVAARVGIDEVHAGLLPADKVALVSRLRESGSRVAMVGDGVNDAPALAAANVGIAMGNGTHIAIESADVVLISSDLADLARALHTARRARRIVWANVVGTVLVDVAGMALAAVGVLGPLLAAIVHVGSESAFILNSARLIPRRRRR
ncbi:heavy metal translocating P-type ATPase [Propionicimonas sp.]|uniref:heavy metal translocating P-type ATPase n=1 Tax=Propionicimonas sp. TaxID=1955623 RepID=UPI0039E5EC52